VKLRTLANVILATSLIAGDAWAVSGLRVKCDQEGADIYLNGKAEGQCPRNIVVTAGKYKVILRKNLEDKSYYYYETEVNLDDNAIEKIEAKLGRVLGEGYYYNKAKSSNTIGDYQEYLRRFPTGQQVEEARKKLETADDDFYAKAKSGNDLEGYQRYLANFPAGRRAPEVKELLGRVYAQQISLVPVKGDCFQMGDIFGDGRENEKPVHEVCVQDFAMGKYEVTVAEFKRFVEVTGYVTDAEKGTGGSKGCIAYDQEDKEKAWAYREWASWKTPNKYQPNIDSHPVSCVSWNDAVEYANWLTSVSDRKFRLPTEAEWEFAARGGSKKRNYWGDGKEEACRYANATDKTALPNAYKWNSPNECTDGHAFVAPIGKFQPNGFGLYDLMGNVSEWTGDWSDDNYFAVSPKDNPQGPAVGSYRVYRGGAFDSNPTGIRVSSRGASGQAYRIDSLGIRLVSPSR
jgi:formylglycine-generating enzyme required for sulfatase activity